MLNLYREQMAYVMVAIAALGSALMYWNHRSRALSEPYLCQDLERHVYKLAQASGTGNAELESLSQTIGDRCESKFSKSYARCLLKSGSLADMQSCKP